MHSPGDPEVDTGSERPVVLLAAVASSHHTQQLRWVTIQTLLEVAMCVVEGAGAAAMQCTCWAKGEFEVELHVCSYLGGYPITNMKFPMRSIVPCDAIIPSHQKRLLIWKLQYRNCWFRTAISQAEHTLTALPPGLGQILRQGPTRTRSQLQGLGLRGKTDCPVCEHLQPQTAVFEEVSLQFERGCRGWRRRGCCNEQVRVIHASRFAAWPCSLEWKCILH